MSSVPAPRINFTYFAFISYKREDEKWARWLRNQLQRYRVPISTRKRNRMLPRQCKPIFMDKTNLNPGLLEEGLRNEVQDSRFIIVICSRHARAESQYLDAELQFFLDSGGDLSRVIPFVVEQAEDVVEELFPRLLAQICTEQTNIVGANIYDDGKQMAVIKTVAAMLGLKREELESDDLRRRKRQRFLAGAAAVLALVGLFLGWDYFYPKTHYYLDYYEVYGVPVGIGSLEKAELASLNGHYAIVTSRRQVRELRYENSAGTLKDLNAPNHFDFAPRKRYSYRDQELDTVQVQDKLGKTSYTLSYKGRSTADLDGIPTAEEGGGIALSIGLAGKTAFNPLDVADPNLNKSNIMRYYYLYDELGRTREIRYASDTWNYAGMDVDGISGLRFERDELGRVVQMEYLSFVGGAGGTIEKDANFAVVGKKNGVAGMAFAYEDLDLTQTRCFDVHHENVLNEAGYCTCSTAYQSHRVTSLSYQDEKGQTALSALGYAEARREYDARGNLVRERYYDADARPTLCAEGYASYEAGYDRKGNRVQLRCLGTDDAPVLCKDGFSSAQADYDERGNQVRVRCFGTDGQPVLHKSGYSSVEADYDDHGNRVSVRYFGSDGQPILHSDGYAQWKSEFDDRGNEVTQRFFNADGQPTLCKDGYALWNAEYDPRGNQVRVSFFDTKRLPVLCKAGYAGWETEYDPRGNPVKVSYFGTDAQPVLCAEGYAVWDSEYDLHGNQVQVRCFGTDGQPVLCTDGYARWEAGYDAFGNQVRVRHFGADGQPVLCAEGYCGYQAEYDDRGRQVRLRYLGTDEAPILCGDGYCSAETEYDMRGNPIQVRFFGTDGQPIAQKNGSAGWDCAYDGRSQCVGMRFFDTDGQPAACAGGYAALESAYDARAQRVRLRYLDAQNRPALCEEGFSAGEFGYDERGNQVRERYFGTDGQPIACRDGYAGWDAAYDAWDRKVRVQYLGTDGQPVLRADGYSRLTVEYDAAGTPVCCRLYDEKGKLIGVV